MVCLRIAYSFSLMALLLVTASAAGDFTAQAGETVLLDFSSRSCGPCQQMRPTVRQLAGAGYPVREVDVMQDRGLAERYGITQVPTFVLLVHGQEFGRTIGATSYGQLERMFQTAGITPAARQAAAPSNQRAPVGLANVDATPSTFASQQGSGSRTQGTQAGGSPTNGLARAAAGSASNTQLLESAVRLTVQDSQGNSTGTGTIVESRRGEALVLTCGHLFRSSGGNGAITVTLFQAGPGGAQLRSTLEGRLVDFDLERDLGLVSFRTSEPVRVAKIAPASAKLASGSSVTTVGCNHGANPTTIATRITTVGRYQGPPNVEAAGAPIEGRSGGGMFNAAGQLVGVCFAADPQGNEGLYSALESIHAKLDSLDLARIYQSPAIDPEAGATQLAAAPAQQPFAVRGQEPTAATPSFPAGTPTPTVSPNPAVLASLSAAEQATLEEIVRRGANSEIICIIRPKTPDGKSEVITLRNASANFVRALTSPNSLRTGLVSEP